MNNPSKLNSWKKIKNYSKAISKTSIHKMFRDNKNRFNNFSLELDNLLFDYSKNHIDKNIIKLFFDLLDEINIKKKISGLFNGEKINKTENRPALHFLLRGSYNNSTKNIFENNVKKCVNNLKTFSKNFENGKIKGFTGKKIKNVINIGIGGSDLGPKMVCEALKFYSNRNINNFFISNIDPSNLTEVLKQVKAEESIFMISSKSFGTIETLKNSSICKDWFLSTAKEKKYFKNHFYGITANEKEAISFGINKNNIFPIWDWVGGRYSLWSAVGLPIILSIGFDNFNQLLKGAYEIDYHFQKEPYEKNIPIILACIGILYNNFMKHETHAVFPYDNYLKYFPAYLQQADMESNGKNISNNSDKINYETGPIIWGDIGTNSQHAFFQLIHQGTKNIPCDFIGFTNSNNEKDDLHEILLSNLIGQSRALMKGKKIDEIKKEFENKKDIKNLDLLIKSKLFNGNKPSNTFLFNKLNPYNLGRLIAIYEHKIFIQGSIWNINSFDQWGVELGKDLSNEIYKIIKNKKNYAGVDSSTKGLLDFINKTRS